MTAGMVCGAIGLGLLTEIRADSSYADLLPGYLLFGISLGLVYAPMSTAAMLAMPREKAGIAAGVVLAALVAVGAVATWALVRRTGGPEPAAEEHAVHRLERRRLHL